MQNKYGKNPYSQYKEMHITTASPAQLVVMLYDGAISAIKLAIEHINNKDYEAKQKQLNKAQDIILELLNTLDVEQGGEVATNLQRLYVYMNKRLIDGSFKLDISALEEVIQLLDDINASWRQLARQQTTGQQMSSGYSDGSLQDPLKPVVSGKI